MLLVVVVGSGIMAQRLSAGMRPLALLANSVATGAGLYALIAALQPARIFNPAVTLLALWRRHMDLRQAAGLHGGAVRWAPWLAC